jgi:hypothetical protein
MGTIADKLTRIITTKEDIRQALISKGYDVPTSIPFKEYAKMILDLPCNADSFPDIEGIVARYSALGLTNEQMAENPVWKNLTGNGHDLQMKNFAWGGMSGVGGYKYNFLSNDWNADVNQVSVVLSHKIVIINKRTSIQLVKLIRNELENTINITLKITGLEANGSSFKIYDNVGSSHAQEYNKDGIYQINYTATEGANRIYFCVPGGNMGQLENPITIEQLPLYPGALVFDGVNDCGTCDNFPILTKEKGYTVVALRQWDQDFLNTTFTGGLLSTRNYSTGEGVAFEKIESSNKGYWNLGAGGIIDFAKSPFTWQTSKQYNNVGILKGDKNHGKLLCVGCGLSGGQHCGRFAILELVFLDHDATEEELNKIKDYFVKTYPWLFPDQAWTVVGKTNEDEDRATIANITGNGNDLILSNFGFAEGSGYNEQGEYAGYLVTDGVDDKITSSIFKMGNDWTVIGDWELINTGKNDNAGIVKFNSIVIYNYNPILINIKNGRNNLIPDQNTVNAICSDGRIYSKDWKESIYNEETESTSKNLLTIGYSGNDYTKIAFRNLAIYPTVLSKEDCIKAYNYLQTLKAK